MQTIPKGSVLSVKIIEDAIAYNETFREKYNKLERYYQGEHDITDRMLPDTLINNRLVVNHAKFITDINTGYLLGNPVTYRMLKESDGDIELIKDAYDKEVIADTDHEIAQACSIFGRAYELNYTSVNEVKTKAVDVRNAVIVYDDTIEHSKMFGIVYRKNLNGGYEDVLVYDAGFEYQCAVNGRVALGKKKAHSYGKIPLICYKNNVDEIGDFEPVLSLIDAYNKVQSDKVNEAEQLVEAILVMKGIDMTPEQRVSLKNSRMISIDNKDVDISFLTKQINVADADTLRQVIESDIHKISMTPNLTDQNFIGNSSGVAIRYKLLAFEQSIMNKERYFEKGLMERFEIYNNYLNKLSSMPLIPTYKVDAVFKRNLPQNDLETSQMIANLADVVDDTTLIGQLSFIDDVQAVVEAMKKQKAENVVENAKMFGTGFPAQDTTNNPDTKSTETNPLTVNKQ